MGKWEKRTWFPDFARFEKETNRYPCLRPRCPWNEGQGSLQGISIPLFEPVAKYFSNWNQRRQLSFRVSKKEWCSVSEHPNQLNILSSRFSTKLLSLLNFSSAAWEPGPYHFVNGWVSLSVASTTGIPTIGVLTLNGHSAWKNWPLTIHFAAVSLAVRPFSLSSRPQAVRPLRAFWFVAWCRLGVVDKSLV